MMVWVMIGGYDKSINEKRFFVVVFSGRFLKILIEILKISQRNLKEPNPQRKIAILLQDQSVQHHHYYYFHFQ